MCTDDNKKIHEDLSFFLNVKEQMLKMCDRHPDITEFRLFKEKIEKAKSFEDLFKTR